jgi:hypothetical protein
MRDQCDAARSFVQHLRHNGNGCANKKQPKVYGDPVRKNFKNGAPYAILLQELDSHEHRKSRCGLKEYPIVSVATIDSLSLIRGAQRRD